MNGMLQSTAHFLTDKFIHFSVCHYLHTYTENDNKKRQTSHQTVPSYCRPPPLPYSMVRFFLLFQPREKKNVVIGNSMVICRARASIFLSCILSLLSSAMCLFAICSMFVVWPGIAAVKIQVTRANPLIMEPICVKSFHQIYISGVQMPAPLYRDMISLMKFDW